MQRWSPDELALPVSRRDAADGGSEQDEKALNFIEDRPSEGAGAFLQRLSERERASLYELVEQELRLEIQEEMRKEAAAETDATRKLVEEFGRAIRWAVDEELRGMARGMLDLALAIGEKLARRSIALDESHLLRVLEGVVEQTEVGSDLRVVANPKCIQRLARFEKELADLNVSKLIPDMTLDPGGCIVQSDGQEWDLTFGGQLETLSESVRDVMFYEGTTAGAETDVASLEVAP